MEVTEHLHMSANAAVFCAGASSTTLQTTEVGPDGCILSPTIINLFLENIMNKKDVPNPVTKTAEFVVAFAYESTSIYGKTENELYDSL